MAKKLDAVRADEDLSFELRSQVFTVRPITVALSKKFNQGVAEIESDEDSDAFSTIEYFADRLLASDDDRKRWAALMEDEKDGPTPSELLAVVQFMKAASGMDGDEDPKDGG